MPYKLVRWRLSFACIAVMLVAVGCFQQVDDESLPNAIAQGVQRTATPTQTATPAAVAEATAEITEETSEPGLLEITATPSVTEPPTSTPPATATPSATPTATTDPRTEFNNLDQPLAQNGSPTATATAASVAQAQDMDDFQLTSTEVVRQITQTVEAEQTATQQAIIGSTPTATIPPVPVVTATNTPPVGVQPPPVSGNDCIHQVQQGQNLFRISLTYGLPIQTIASANGIINPSLIIMTQCLVIPGCGNQATSQSPQFRECYNPSTPPNGGIVQPPSGNVYIVQPNDNLFRISLAYNVPVADIAAANNIQNWNLIVIGQQLVIP